jgi:hypothetical protein
MTSSERPEVAETAAGAVQGGGVQDATRESAPATDGSGQDEEFDAGEFVVEHDADPPEDQQPTTS